MDSRMAPVQGGATLFSSRARRSPPSSAVYHSPSLRLCRTLVHWARPWRAPGQRAAGGDEPRPDVLTRAAVLGTSLRWHQCRAMRQRASSEQHTSLHYPFPVLLLLSPPTVTRPSFRPRRSLPSTPLLLSCSVAGRQTTKYPVLTQSEQTSFDRLDSWCRLCSGVPLAGTRTRQLAVLASWALERTCRRLLVPGLGAGIPLPLALSTASAPLLCCVAAGRPCTPHPASSIHLALQVINNNTFHVPALRS